MTHQEELRRRVVCAVIFRIERDGSIKLLLALRDRRSNHPNTWESPGGKIEEGETAQQALMRELREELGVNSCIIGKAINCFTLDPPQITQPTMLTFYHVMLGPDDPPQALQSRCLAWFEADDLDDLKLMPGNIKMKLMLQHIMRTRTIP